MQGTAREGGRGRRAEEMVGKRRNSEDLGASHRQRTDFTRQHRYPIVTANAGYPFVTGARDGHSESAKFAPDASALVDLCERHL